MDCIGCNEPMEKIKSGKDTFHQCISCKRRFLKRGTHLYEIQEREKLREVRQDEMPEM